MNDWLLIYGVPAGAMVIAVFGWVYGYYISQAFKKKYPMTDAEFGHCALGE